jgi:hypothetical protein
MLPNSSAHRRRLVRSACRRLLLASIAIGALAPAGAAAEAAAPPASSAASADWLTTVNHYRAMAGLSAVTEAAAMSSAAQQHSCYMLANGMSHDEVPGRPGYTAEGDTAGNNGNVAVSSGLNATDGSHVELWMTGPFHAIGILRPNLDTVGFGACHDAATSPWKSGATLDVLRGLGAPVTRSTPILFPGDGTATSLDRFIAETPDPRTYCGYSGTVGLPLIAMMPEAVTGAVTATITGPNGPIETCALSGSNTDGAAQSILTGDNAVVAVPKSVLAPGKYSVQIVTGSRTVAWSFTVDPAAKVGVSTRGPVPVPTAAPAATSLAFEAVTPVRLADTREGLGASRLSAGQSARLQIGGRATVPAGAGAVSANFTVTGTAGAGYLTVWNCSAERPMASTVNFSAADTVANAASVPMDANGGICVYSPVDTDLVVDVSGYYEANGSDHFAAMTPTRLMDTRLGLGGAGRLAAGQTVALQVTAPDAVPAGSRAAVLNVTSVDPGADGFVTVYPCDMPRPLAAALNPKPGQIRPNLVITPLSSDGRVCIFSSNDVDLVVDATGYLSSAATWFTATAPFRFTDTREVRSVEMNAGTGGRLVQAGETVVLQIAGERGIPVGTTAVSVNLAVTDAIAAGFLTAYPCGARPTTSNVNYIPRAAASTGAVLQLSHSGQLCMYVSAPSHVIVDVNGWWS